MIDLHCHSTASDGSLTPRELVAAAVKAGIKTLALTDHDTTAGLGDFLTAAKSAGLRGIPGIELSCQLAKAGKCHIVGLFVRRDCSVLQSLVQQIRVWRQERNEQILQKLADLGCFLSPTDIAAAGAEHAIGRPHIARGLVSRGYCPSQQAAFQRYLERGRPAFVSRRTVSAEEGLCALRQAGAVVFWAHPFTRSRMTAPRCRLVVDELVACGLDGLEAYYPLHTQAQTANALAIAQEKSLLVSGGSDFHGAGMPGIALGTGRGRSALVPPEVLPAIIERASQRS